MPQRRWTTIVNCHLKQRQRATWVCPSSCPLALMDLDLQPVMEAVWKLVCRALMATESAEMDSDLGGRRTLHIYEVDILKRSHCSSGSQLLAGAPEDQAV